jgi:hypothetical protein
MKSLSKNRLWEKNISTINFYPPPFSLTIKGPDKSRHIKKDIFTHPLAFLKESKDLIPEEKDNMITKVLTTWPKLLNKSIKQRKSPCPK